MKSCPRSPLAPLVAVVLALVACGGGGSSSVSPSPTATPTTVAVTPTPGPSASTSAQGCANQNPACSTFSVSSNPSGLSVALNGSVVGTTPVTVSPAISSATQTITVDPSGGNYAVQVAQTQSGVSRTIFYNKLADTTGQVNTASIQSALRATESVSTSGWARRVPSKLGGTPGVSQTMLYVHYSVSALQAAGRRTSDVESALGITRSAQIGAARGDDELRAVAVPSGQSIDAVASALRAQTGVTSVVPVQLRYAESTTPTYPNDCHFGAPSGDSCAQFVPSTLGLGPQWDFFKVGAPNAWAYPGVTNSSVKIAIIDTGYDCPVGSGAQDDLSANVVFQESVINGAVNTGTCAAEDTDGHGTNVSGIADAVTDNSIGFAGIAYNAKLYEYRIFPPGVGTAANTSDEALAIQDAIGRGVQVINLSLGSEESLGADPGEQTAIENAIAANVTVVAAAGNETVTTIDYPAAYNGVISVGATSLADGQPNGASNSNGSATAPTEYIASYTNYGPGLGLVAPGGDPCCGGADNDLLHWISNLYSTGDTTTGDTCSPTNQPDRVCAALFAGTSQATPHVTGAAALLLAAHPGLTPAQVAQYLESTADDICAASSSACPAGTTMEGHGRLDIYRALAALTGDTSPPAYRPASSQFVAFAYTGTLSTNRTIVGGNVILDTTYPSGVPVSSTGSFRIGDLPTSVTGAWKIGVWYNAAGNGILTAGDSFGVVTCSGQSSCTSAASNVTISRVTASSQF